MSPILSLAGICGTTKSCATCANGGCAMRKIGINSRLPNTSSIENRSNRRKSPVLTAAMIRPAAMTTPATLFRPR